MATAARTVTVSAEVEAAFAEAASRGERLVLAASDGRTLVSLEPFKQNDDDALFTLEPEDPEQDQLDSEELTRAIAAHHASGEPMVPLRDVWDELWGKD
jgi:hypothetical protein